MPTWETYLPATLGHLPNGVLIPRTDPGGSFDAKILILGVYPAARVEQQRVGGRVMNLPVQVEQTSFEIGVSASGRDLDDNYIQPLRLSRGEVLLVDVMPYYLANTRRNGDGARTMWENLQDCQRVTGDITGIEPRPTEPKLVQLARAMPGNLDRLTDYFTRCRPHLILTLGVEAAAVVRNESFGTTDRRKRHTFYADPVGISVFGVETEVVHLVHPGLLMSTVPGAAWWRGRHAAWCSGSGRELVTAVKSAAVK